MLSGLGGRSLTSPSGATISQWISFELQSYRDFRFRRAKPCGQERSSFHCSSDSSVLNCSSSKSSTAEIELAKHSERALLRFYLPNEFSRTSFTRKLFTLDFPFVDKDDNGMRSFVSSMWEYFGTICLLRHSGPKPQKGTIEFYCDNNNVRRSSNAKCQINALNTKRSAVCQQEDVEGFSLRFQAMNHAK